MKHSRLLGWSFGAVLCSYASLGAAQPGEVSFTPTGLKLSVMRIVLSQTDEHGNPTAQAVLYTCPHATEEECLVDVTSQSELDALGAAVGTGGETEVNVGSYDTVSLEM